MESWQLVKDIKRLKQHRKINQQQYRTLLGQIKSGDVVGAKKGYLKLLQNSYHGVNHESIRKI